MPANQTRTVIPDDSRDYRVRAFFDDESPDDLPDLHVEVCQPVELKSGTYHGHVVATEIILVAPTDPDDCREFWTRVKAAAEAALERVEAAGAAINAAMGVQANG